MDNIADGVTNAIKDFLINNEKRASTQQSIQDSHSKVLESIQTRLTSLEDKCQELSTANSSLTEQCQELSAAKDTLENKCRSLADDNENLKAELQRLRERDEEIAKGLEKPRVEFDEMHHLMVEFDKFKNLCEVLVRLTTSLDGSRQETDKKLKEIQESISQIIQAKQVKRQHQQLTSASHRTPVRSPSASSFLNGNNHGSITRTRPSPSYRNNLYLESVDVNDEIRELSDQAEKLEREVEILNDLQRSFEKSSFYSDE